MGHQRRLTGRRAEHGRGKALGRFGWTREPSERAIIIEALGAETRTMSHHRTPQCGSSWRHGWTKSSTRGQGTAWGGFQTAGPEQLWWLVWERRCMRQSEEAL
jgi:hypothetical protein